MLNDRERNALAKLEELLATDDPCLDQALRDWRWRGLRPWWHWPSMLAFLVGVGLTIGSLAVRLPPLAVEGVVLAVTGLGWNRVRAYRMARQRPAYPWLRRENIPWKRLGSVD